MAAEGVPSVFSRSSPEKLLAEKPPDEASELIFEGVPVTPEPADAEPAKEAEGGKNVQDSSQKEAEEKAPGQAGQAKVQGDTSRGIEFQVGPPERSEAGHALSLTAREEDCFQILGRPGLPWGQWRGWGLPVSPLVSLRHLTQPDPSKCHPTPGSPSS